MTTRARVEPDPGQLRDLAGELAEVDGECVAGMVHAPALGETYLAARGADASCRQVPLAVSTTPSLETALVGTGFGYTRALRTEQARVVADLLPKIRDLRRSGSAAIDLCWVAQVGGLAARRESGGLTFAANPALTPEFVSTLRGLGVPGIGGPEEN